MRDVYVPLPVDLHRLVGDHEGGPLCQLLGEDEKVVFIQVFIVHCNNYNLTF